MLNVLFEETLRSKPLLFVLMEPERGVDPQMLLTIRDRSPADVIGWNARTIQGLSQIEQFIQRI